MFELNGDFGKAIFESARTDGGTVSSNLLSLDTEASLNFFKKISIIKSNIALNSIGLFSFARAGRNGKVRFANLTTPRHLWQKRLDGCVWRSKGKIKMGGSSMGLDPIEYNGEQCPDSLHGCLEGIFGTGNLVRDIMGTKEGVALFSMIVQEIYAGLGNSFYDLISFGGHSLIEDAGENDWYSVDDDEWEDYVDQQEATTGYMTLVDDLKEDGRDNYTVPIHRGDISLDGDHYIGNVADLFDRVLQKQTPELKLAAKRTNSMDKSLKSILLVDPRIFNKYKSELVAQWNGIPETLMFYMSANFSNFIGRDNKVPMDGVLMYDGHIVVCMDEWDSFDAMVGAKTYRCMAVAPGVFGIGYDIESIDRDSGYGLRITQHLTAPWKGKVFMDTTLKVGTTILDEKFIVNASLVLTPPVAA